jgi:hypothetical protein
VLVALGLAALVAVGAFALLRDRDGGGNGGGGNGGGATGAAVALTGVRGYDPQGTGGVGEHDDEAPAATDSDPTSAWSTEHYLATLADLGKGGVGLLLEAPAAANVRRLTVTTDTPGFVAKVQAGDAEGGPFRDVSGEQTVGARTTFELHDAKARYFVVWITQLPDGLQADVNEVTAST